MADTLAFSIAFVPALDLAHIETRPAGTTRWLPIVPSMALGSHASPSVTTRAATIAREVAGRAYHRLARLNYEQQWLARTNRTPAGEFQCYELCNRHGSDSMLAELDAVCGPSAVIYDLGANVGIYTLALATAAPQRHLIAVEPSPTTAVRLRANVALNDISEQVTVLEYGLGDEPAPTTSPFYRSSNPELSSFDRESATRWGARVREVNSVPVVSLDDLVLTDSLPAPDAIKIDVEGMAPAVIRGARETLARYEPTVVLEYHEDGLSGNVPEETKGVLQDLSYEIRQREGYWRCEPR
ncbi:FkbM family methyltransferase [Natrialba magadii ATCC 43099]|uniref:FkbM family methyltransferase n=1 Tax=Natrialba magadii (strain ATCC 43099 / DSM 3394 / CCM 3739 / CIP 104546 / IAM 13178 / JCM 8861 / NBRC 102185 / NCIMB 2190 / MS3) TaxID=547559 RepID=D3SV17_NATMM|nr:FkbM family methyltransferase [Natrialba magadii]ADD05425.1 FkbM family methyltransferase [Natrialba magadii ATCC 43099]ELY29261.1 FkbM family methyltransferase [Natrialba magadii ATCC 43099]